MLTTQITYSRASEDYRSGKVSLDKSFGRVDGLVKSYAGYQTEDPAVLFWVKVWTTKDACDAFTKHADYAKVANVMQTEPAAVNYVRFEDIKAFDAPITEFVTFTLKEGKRIDQLEPLVQELHQKLAGTVKFHGDSWAPIIDKPNVYHGILGWDTVKAHWDAVSDGPLKEVIDRVKLVADLWLVHAALKPVVGSGGE